MKIIIPASGVGKRFQAAGYTDTKPLIQVTEDKKIIDFVVDCFDKENDEFFFITSPATHDVMQSYIEKMGINYKHFLATGPIPGPVASINKVRDELSKFISSDDEVIVSYCDYGMKWDYEMFKQFLEDESPDIAVPCYTGYHPHLEHKENVYAVCKSYEGSVYEIIEKYDSKDRLNESWSAGCYYFTTFGLMQQSFDRVVKSGKMVNDEYYVSLACNEMCDDYLVKSFDYIEKFYQFGTPRDFEYAKNKLNIINNISNKHTSFKNTVVLSAGKGERFFNFGFAQPKPFIPLLETDFVTNIEEAFKDVETNIRFIGSDSHEKYWNMFNRDNVKLIPSNKIGAAYSYIQGASDLSGETLIVPCDLIAQHITDGFNLIKETADVIVFTSDPSEYCLNNKKSFAWVGGQDNVISDITVKEYKQGNEMILIGSFWVRNNSFLIEQLHEIMDEKKSINGEYYLDNAFVNMLNKKIKVHYVKLDNYLSMGTPDEYKENKYWYEV